MIKRAILGVAAAMAFGGVALAGDGGPGHEIKVSGLRCHFDRGADVDTHATSSTLSVFNTFGGVIPAGAVVDVSFLHQAGVIPLRGSIVTRNDTATGNLISLTSDPFTPVGRLAKHTACAASAHWVAHIPLRTR